ncbi:ATP-binding cassette sub-family B member 9 [Trichinella zimbabwensis]|uniref:ATP-binding cassette sub-family B member 9 n=1 Tax=Trichinella zimbabwensis TaxID=268475 RepID=A0A0V1GUL6_9BILA|nr:ATP-binding cassette sub-family B member 9 [Trichinella zimbabwensis]
MSARENVLFASTLILNHAMCRKRTRAICAAVIRKVESLVTVKCKDLNIDLEDKKLSLYEVMKIAVDDFDGEYIRLETIQQLIRNSKLLELFDNDGMVRRSRSAPSPIDCTIFVDNLPGNITEAYLRSAFKCCGDILDVYFPYCKQSLHCKKRFAFVQFTSSEAVSKACRTDGKNERSFKAKAENPANLKTHCPIAKTTAASEMQMQKFFPVKHKRRRRRRKCKMISKNCDLPKDWEIFSWKQWYNLKMIYKNIQLQNFTFLKWTLKGQTYIINRYREQVDDEMGCSKRKIKAVNDQLWINELCIVFVCSRMSKCRLLLHEIFKQCKRSAYHNLCFICCNATSRILLFGVSESSRTRSMEIRLATVWILFCGFTLVDWLITGFACYKADGRLSSRGLRDALLAFSFQTSLVDFVAMPAGRFSMLLGGLVGVTVNRKGGPLRVRRASTIFVSVAVLMMIHSPLKLLAVTEPEHISIRWAWFWVLFVWNLTAALLFAAFVVGLLGRVTVARRPSTVRGRSTKRYRGTGVEDGDLPTLVKPSAEGADTGDQASVHLDTSIIKQTYENLRIRESSVSILRLLSYCKAEWLWYALGFVFLLLYSLCRIFIPYYTGKVIFDIIAWNSYETLMKSVMYMTLLSLASSIFAGFRAGCLEYGYVKVNLSIRRDLFCALLKQEVGFFDVNSTGVIMSRLSSDCQSMSDYVSLNLNIFLRNLVMLIGSLIVMANLSWRLTMMNFVAFPLIVLVSKVFGGRYENLSQNAQDSLANVCDVAEEVLSNIRTVKSFANEDGEVRRFQSKVQIITNIYKKKAIAVFGYTLLNELFSMIILVAVLWYGGHLVMVKKISSENLIPYLLYQLQLGEALISISGVYAGLRQAVGASKKVFELIDRKPEIVNAGKLTSANVRGLVEFRNVSFSYPSRPHQQVLTNVSFKLNPGEMVALVGPSGGGKSSCIALLEHFYEPSSGQVLLDGVPVQEYDHKFFHKKVNQIFNLSVTVFTSTSKFQVSLVSQEPVLFARSIRENISYGLEADEVSTAEIIRSAEQANASHFITLFADSFNTNVGEKGIQLSGGQKQRLAIARSLVRCPTVLLLDEATSALDAESEFLVQQAIYRNLAGHTVLLIAHRLSTVEKADRIIVIDAGRIVQQGNHEQLLSEDGLYKNLIHRQLHGDESKQ